MRHIYTHDDISQTYMCSNVDLELVVGFYTWASNLGSSGLRLERCDWFAYGLHRWHVSQKSEGARCA